MRILSLRTGSKSTNGPATKRSEAVLSAPHSSTRRSASRRRSGPPRECKARRSVTRNSHRLGYWREMCSSGSAAVDFANPSLSSGKSCKLDHGSRAWPPRHQTEPHRRSVGEPETKAHLRAELEVRIQFPPAVSLRTFGSGGGLPF